MFLAHFVGDVHQPLHCGHTDDLGGNTIVVHWYRRKTNLHHVRTPAGRPSNHLLANHASRSAVTDSILQVWDVNVIETAMKDFYGNDQSTMIQAIQQNITVGN